MKAYAEVIGDPIAHSRSPLIHRFWCERVGIEAEYRVTQVKRDELRAYFEVRRRDPCWRGCNVTAPLKELAGSHLNRIRGAARAIGAVNCVVRSGAELVGHNSDVDGVAEALAAAQVENRSIAIIGAGGGARAAMGYLASRAPRAIRVLARDLARAQALRALVPSAIAIEQHDISEVERAFYGTSVIVNATPLGMTGAAEMPQPVLAALNGAVAGAKVFDMIYDPQETELLRKARELGLHGVDGLTMLVGQADAAFRLFFGAAPPRDRDGDLHLLLSASFH